MAGDLNDVAYSSEKAGGAPFNYHRAIVFNNRVKSCNLIDLGFTGSLFTWVGRRHGGSL